MVKQHSQRIKFGKKTEFEPMHVGILEKADFPFHYFEMSGLTRIVNPDATYSDPLTYCKFHLNNHCVAEASTRFLHPKSGKKVLLQKPCLTTTESPNKCKLCAHFLTPNGLLLPNCRTT